MERQLALLDNQSTGRQRPPAKRANSRWQLDERTREVGRKGVAAAREALAEAVRRTAA